MSGHERVFEEGGIWWDAEVGTKSVGMDEYRTIQHAIPRSIASPQELCQSMSTSIQGMWTKQQQQSNENKSPE